jgi:hypothetical protein
MGKYRTRQTQTTQVKLSRGQCRRREEEEELGSSRRVGIGIGGERTRTRRQVILILWTLLYAGAVLFGTNKSAAEAAPSRPRRDLRLFSIFFEEEEDGNGEGLIGIGTVVGGPNCTTPSVEDFPPDLFTRAEREGGALALHFIASFYCFYALLLVCDDFFVPSIEAICRGKDSAQAQASGAP